MWVRTCILHTRPHARPGGPRLTTTAGTIEQARNRRSGRQKGKQRALEEFWFHSDFCCISASYKTTARKLLEKALEVWAQEKSLANAFLNKMEHRSVAGQRHLKLFHSSRKQTTLTSVEAWECSWLPDTWIPDNCGEGHTPPLPLLSSLNLSPRLPPALSPERYTHAWIYFSTEWEIPKVRGLNPSVFYCFGLLSIFN